VNTHRSKTKTESIYCIYNFCWWIIIFSTIWAYKNHSDSLLSKVSYVL